MSTEQSGKATVLLQESSVSQKDCGDSERGTPKDNGGNQSSSSNDERDDGDKNQSEPAPNESTHDDEALKNKATENDIHRIQSCLCPNCGGGDASTVLLPTTIPGFREIILVTLTCDDCSFRNSQVSFSGEIQPLGERTIWTVTERDEHDATPSSFLNRQILKSDSATIRFPTLDDLEIPCTTQQGVLTTVEGLLQRVKDNLEEQQPERLRLGDVENFYRCQRVIDKILRVLRLSCSVDDTEDTEDDECGEDNKAMPLFPFQLIIDDPAGNSFLENPYAPNPDPNVRFEKYQRTHTQDLALGLQPSQPVLQDESVQKDNSQQKNSANATPIDLSEHQSPHLQEEAISIPTTCPQCNRSIDTKMCAIHIPHFQESILFCTLCEQCGYKSNEIKSGGGIPSHGARLILKVSSQGDLKRDVLKSDTAGIEIPELDFQMSEGGLGGIYTTVEGLLRKMRDRLMQANPFATGDSASQHHASNDGEVFSKPDPKSERFQAFLQTLLDMSQGKRLPFTLIMSDPMAGSFIGPIAGKEAASGLQDNAPIATDVMDSLLDANLRLERFERTMEQDETLGTADIKTENYGA